MALNLANPREMLEILREIVRRAVLVLASLPDPDARFLNLGGGAWDVVRSSADAYGYTEVEPERVVPTAADITQMEIVMGWLAWLRQQPDGDLDLRRLMAWAKGVEAWKLARREKCTERTIRSRVDRSIAAIQSRFFGDAAAVDEVNETYRREPRAFVLQTPLGGRAGSNRSRAKVWIDGEGFMRRGKRRTWEKQRDGTERIDERRLNANRPR